MHRRRCPRFQRCADPGPIHLTRRDIAVLQKVHQYRFLRSTHLIQLLTGSPQQLLRRLQALYHHGYLDRPRIQIDYYRAGSRPIVYGIGRRGIAFLRERGFVPSRVRSSELRGSVSTRFSLCHTLAVADAVIAFEVAASRGNGPGILHHREAGARSFQWRVHVPSPPPGADLGLVPDWIFALNVGADGNPLWIFLEVDRGTMPVRAHGLRRSSLHRKIIAYQETWRQGVLRPTFPRFRVLTLTTSQQRVEHLVDLTRRMAGGNGSRLFLFGLQEDVLRSSDPLSFRFRNGKGEESSLAD